MSALVLDRHELLWVLEQSGAGGWPYPLRPVHWSAETDSEVLRHRDATEQALRARGLLEPGPARMLLDVGRAVAGWVVAVDLVRRDAHAPLAAVALTDGRTAAVLESPEHARAPVRVAAYAPDALAEAVFTLVPPVPPGTGPAVPVVAPGAFPADLPATRRATRARDAADELLGTVTAVTQVGVADRRDGTPRRVAAPLCWIDGPRGRYVLRPPPPGPPSRPPQLVPATGGQLLTDIRTVLADAAVPRPPGRSTA